MTLFAGLQRKKMPLRLKKRLHSAMLGKMQLRSGDSTVKKSVFLILLLLAALFGAAAGFCPGAGEDGVPAFLPSAELFGERADAGMVQSPASFSPDEALLPGSGARIPQSVRSGGTVRPVPLRMFPAGCEAVGFSFCLIPEGGGELPVPDFPPQILFWLASTLEVRAGPCAVRIG